MAPPALMDDLVEDVLLRFPPDDPASLVRAALVCKPWCRIVSSEGFRRRFREFHRRPPVLGLLCNFRRVHLYDDEGYVFRFVPTASFPGNRAFHYNNRRAIDARHGRILLRGILWEDDDLMNDEFVVWDPMTREERMLPALPRYPHSWNAAVLCAAHPSGACDHLDCHRGPFLVVFVVVDTEAGHMFVHVYSSETGSWSEQTVPHPNKPANWLWPSVLVGNALYFMLGPRRTILKYNLGTRDISMIDLPPILYKPDVLTTTEDGRLGFAAVRKSRLCLWSREAGPERDAGWAEIRVIELEKLLPADALLTSPTVVGFADGMGIVFVGTQLGVFSIDLKSQQAKNVYDGNGCDVLPYMSFYIPVR